MACVDPPDQHHRAPDDGAHIAESCGAECGYVDLTGIVLDIVRPFH